MKDIPIVPIWHNAYSSYFVRDGDLWPANIEGHPVLTGVLAVDRNIDLINLSSDTNTIKAGLTQTGDVIKSDLRVDKLFLKEADSIIEHETSLAVSSFFRVEENGKADLRYEAVVCLNGTAKSAGHLLYMLFLHKVQLTMKFQVTGTANLNSGNIMVSASPEKTWVLEDAETGAEISHTDPQWKELVEIIHCTHIVGFTVQGTRGPKVAESAEPARKPSYLETEARMVAIVAQELTAKKASTKRRAIFDSIWSANAHESTDFKDDWYESENGGELVNPSGYPLATGKIVTCMDHKSMRKMILVGTPFGTVTVYEKYAYGEENYFGATFPNGFPVLLINVVCGEGHHKLSSRGLRNLLGAPHGSAPNIGDLVLNLTKTLVP